MARNHIHFAIGYNSDSNVVSGMRNSSDVIIEIDVPKAMKDGYRFLRSKNNVILCPGLGSEGQIPPAYFKNVIFAQKGANKEIVDLQPFKYLLILDFEANCIENGTLKCQEIIEFPVVPVDVAACKILDDKIFHTYVKPTVVPEITPFCTSLTGITQETTDKGVSIEQALSKLDKWMNDNGFTEQNSTFITCGQWDLKTCLKNEAEYKKINLPSYLKNFINIKDLWCAMNFKDKAPGMVGMLESAELKLEGKHHSGIDDSKNIARIALDLIKQGTAITKQQQISVKD